jgi:hypothetical protein
MREYRSFLKEIIAKFIDFMIASQHWSSTYARYMKRFDGYLFSKSQTTSSTGGLILPFKGMVLCVPLRHGSQHHWYYWLASLRRLIFILH